MTEQKHSDQNVVELINVSKSFGENTILENINLYIKRNEFLTLLGPSGCGKSTILRLIGGFETPTGGEIFCNGKLMNNVPPHKRPLNNVFQRYALFDHMNIFENIAFGLKIAKVDPEEIKTRVNNMLHLVNLDGYGKRSTDSLSGGQMQRVAMARALVNQPQLLLLDEPLAALDLKMRQDMQLELKNMQKQLGITFLYVTHDQEEALAMSDTVVVMDGGKFQQLGTPEDVYNEPNNAFVADFIGESNIIGGLMLEDNVVNFGGKTFTCMDGGFGTNEAVDVVVRPEDIEVVAAGAGMISGVVRSAVFYGMHYEMEVEAEGFTWLIQSTKMELPDTMIGMNIEPDSIHIMKKSHYSDIFGTNKNY